MRKPDRRRPLYLAAGAVAVVAILAALIWGGSGGSKEASATLFPVEEGPLTISVTENGTIKNRDQVVIKSEVEGRAAILFLVGEGVNVKKGDLLIELDGTGIEEQRASQQITVINAEASFIRARENLAVAKNQAESDVAKAQQDLKFAEIDLQKYEEGDYPQALQQADADITIATEDVKRAEEKLNWSRRLHEQRYLSLVDLQADELAHKKAKLELELAQNRKRVLEEFSHRRDQEALVSAVSQAKMALERVTRKAAADTVQAEADLRAKEQEFQRQKTKLEKLEAQLKKTKIFAPIDGMVVYATTGRGGGRRDSEEPLAEGQEVRERQELIYLPTAQSMLAEVKIPESSLKKVKVGMPCRVTVDAVPNRLFAGRVAKIAVLPDATSWWGNPDLKVYNSEIHLDDGVDLRAGMSCRAEIVVETYASALFVPIQCVVREGGRTVVYRPSAGGPAPAPVEVGLDNNSMVRILSGVKKGDQVLLNPPLSGEPAPAEEEEGAATPVVPKERASPAPGPPSEAPGGAKAGTPSDGTDWRSMTPEERRKRWESLTPEEQKALRERMRGGAGGEEGK